MSAICYKSQQLDLIVLVSFNHLNKEGRINLKKIRFFKNLEDVTNCLDENQLKLIKNQNLNKFNTIKDLIKLLTDYFSGKSINLTEEINSLNIEIDLNKKFKTLFSQRVIRTVMQLKRGEIATYSEIAEKIGSKAYRAIGNVLRNNPLPLIIPCHRVVKKSGDIGGFMGNTNKEWQQNLKRSLLQLEGVTSI